MINFNLLQDCIEYLVYFFGLDHIQDTGRPTTMGPEATLNVVEDILYHGDLIYFFKVSDTAF